LKPLRLHRSQFKFQWKFSVGKVPYEATNQWNNLEF
jgi:hypothetical protein